MGLKTIWTTEVLCFELWSRALVKGVIPGVTMDVQIEYLRRIPGVVGAWRLIRWEKKKKVSVLFFDEEEISTHVKLGYVRYTVRALIPKPLQCKNCKGFGRVSSVCRGTEYIEERCVEGRRCCNSGGDHEPECPECPVRLKEIEVAKDRVANRISYVEAITIIEKASDVSEDMVVDTPQPVVNVCWQMKDTRRVK